MSLLVMMMLNCYFEDYQFWLELEVTVYFLDPTDVATPAFESYHFQPSTELFHILAPFACEHSTVRFINYFLFMKIEAARDNKKNIQYIYRFSSLANVESSNFFSALYACICFSSSASMRNDFLLSSSKPSAMVSTRAFSSDNI